VSASGWRVVLVTVLPMVVEPFTQMVRALGHEPVALITRPRVGFPDVSEVVAATPPGADLLVPSSKDRLAPLLRACDPDLLLCLAFPWLIPDEALAVPRLGAVNTHPSLLPRYRGPNPLGWAFRNGDAEVGLTFHRMSGEFDTGPILAQGSVPLDEDYDPEEVGPQKLGPLAAELFPRALERVAAGHPGDPQDDAKASYAGLFEDEWAEIDWTRTAREVHNQVRSWVLPSVGGIRGPLTTLAGERVRVLRTRLADEHGRGRPGEILKRQDGRLLTRCGDGPLWVLESEPADSG
jgi:methionyl-tRNA formyltransferase